MLDGDDHRHGDDSQTDLDIVRRAYRCGFDPIRVASALGVELRVLDGSEDPELYSLTPPG
jgi:hypothetical protein